MGRIFSAFTGSFGRKIPRQKAAEEGSGEDAALLDYCTEGLKFRSGAVGGDAQGGGEGEAEHFHEALAVDAAAAVVQVHRERLGGGDVDEFFHVPDRAEGNHKIGSIFHLALYKPFFFVYNKRKSNLIYYIGGLLKRQLWGLDDFSFPLILKLAVLHI